MIKRILSAMLILCLMGCLSGCRSKTSQTDVPEWQAAEVSYEVPDGDVVVQKQAGYELYLPGKSGAHLIPQTILLEAAGQYEMLQNLVRSLLSHPGNDQVQALSPCLVLSGTHGVELSNGVCTVNLTKEALQLGAEQLYEAALAISATLCALPCVQKVNVLVEGQSVGMDASGNLPMGNLGAYEGEYIQVLWDKLDAKRAPDGESLSEAAFLAEVSLYFPLLQGRGMIAENRKVIFEGQTPGQLAEALLQELDRGSLQTDITDHNVSILSLLLEAPQVSEMAGGGRLITLNFEENLVQKLSTQGIGACCWIGAVVYTLTSFIPGVAAVCVQSGGEPLTKLEPENAAPIERADACFYRADFSALLMGTATVYYVQQDLLLAGVKAIGQKEADSPRAQLLALIQGPEPAMLTEGITSPLPATLTDDDILGVGFSGDTLLMNLSDNFRRRIAAWGSEKEMLLCYSIVNTLCENSGMKAVCFYFEGSQVQSIAGAICWDGVFVYNPGLIAKSYG